jgi:hypothetical protein
MLGARNEDCAGTDINIEARLLAAATTALTIAPWTPERQARSLTTPSITDSPGIGSSDR